MKAPVADTQRKDGKVSQFTIDGFSNTFATHLDIQNVQAQTACMIVDLSDTTNWPHVETGHINVEYIIIEVDPDGSYVGEVKLGFLTNVDATNGDFHQVIDIDMQRKADIVIENIDFGSHGIDLQTDHWFGPTTQNSTLFQTDVNLRGPDGTTAFPSGDGDLVMIIERTAGSVDVSVTIGYETAP